MVFLLFAIGFYYSPDGTNVCISRCADWELSVQGQCRGLKVVELHSWGTSYSLVQTLFL